MNDRKRATRVGLNLTLQYLPGEDPARALDDHLRLVAAVEQAGWDSVFVAQHYLSEEMAHLQPLPLLGRLSAVSGDMRLGSGICLLALQNPVDTAEAYATADVLCGGRLVFGAGLGYRDLEYDAFAVAAGGRVTRFTHNLDLVRRLWAAERVDADLPWCRLDGASLSVLPVQRPGPPVWLAANSDKAVRRAALLGDAWMINPHAAMTTVERQMGMFRSVRAEAGLPDPTDVPLMREVVCAPDRATAAARARRHLAAKYATYKTWGQDTVLPEGDRFDADLANLSRDRFAIGDPDDCLRTLRAWTEATGATELVLRVHWAGAPVEEALESVELLTRHVLPYL
ncbi:LLM class flavin-dependent oxidoreductase [Streptomyces sp. SID8379]|uniref:LLM class flavin-dependent oxidoreductase n=1 Tax=unclassified Streptomyces TaxID=2593676 RepID=UPI0005B788DB|nr:MULTISPECIES: LLM class flavin-dependent oxidoreductase [unclassified Streptomyces]MYW67538.1 LLM class flavin-dependent oxidoreductase [Streptomyces sp. SID8379]